MPEVWQKYSFGILTATLKPYQPTLQQTLESNSAGCFWMEEKQLKLIGLNLFFILWRIVWQTFARWARPSVSTSMINVCLCCILSLRLCCRMIFQNEGPAHRIVSQKFELWVPQVMLASGGKSWLMKILLKLIDWHQPRGCWWHYFGWLHLVSKSQSCFCLLLADPKTELSKKSLFWWGRLNKTVHLQSAVWDLLLPWVRL